MKQLPLPVRLDDHAVFDGFLPGANAVAVHALRDAAGRRAGAVIWIWGAPGSGRTHLLQACVEAADGGGGRAAYLPLAELRGFPPAVLDGMEETGLLCLDDIDCVAGDAGWEGRLFSLYERLRSRGSRVVLAAGGPPAEAGFDLPDLVSRFSSGATFRLEPLSDEQKIEAMLLRAKRRGFTLPDETVHYLIRRVDRGPAELFALLDRLEIHALAERKHLTIPFVRSVLGSGPEES